VNTYADVKAEVDYCCTSGNATAMLRALLDAGHDRVVFLPDEYLAKNTAHEVGVPIVIVGRSGDRIEQEEAPAGARQLVIGWRGRCEVHEQFTVADVASARKQFPDVTVLAHPECSPEVVEASDYSGSTTQMARFASGMKHGRLLLLTECSMGDNIAATSPKADLIRMCSVRCPHMNQITLEQTLEALREDRYEVEVAADVRERAQVSLDRMLQIG
jgi:quinolinate synthase